MTEAVRSARWRLAALWLAQVGRILADNCLRLFVVLEVARAGGAERDAAWHLTTALLALPAILLSPLNGALSNSLPKRGVLVAATGFCLAALLLFGWAGGPWPACWALVALAWVVYSPARYALLPAAAADAEVPLTRVNGWIEMGAFLAIVGGLLLGGELYHAPDLLGLPAPVAAAASALTLLALLAALPVRFPSDVRRAEPIAAAVAGFFRDTRRVLIDAEARGSLLGLAVLRGLVVGMTGAVVACTLARQSGDEVDVVPDLVRVGLWILAGVAAGSFLASVQGHPFRALGLVPFGATGLLAGLVWAAVVAAEAVPSAVCLFLGVMGGLVNVPVAATYQANVPPDAQANGMAVRNLAEYLGMAVVGGTLYGLARGEVLSPRGQLWLVAGLAAAGTTVAWGLLLRPAFEQFVEVVLWPFYRVRAHGPGVGHLPLRGPLLIVANHSAYMDPLFVGKVVPRPLTPMMTSYFYDRPGVHFLMAHVLRPIRVESSTYRREVPELREAVAALDRGACLLVFPEALLRRQAEVPLRRFGQGVWHILRERPETPVVTLWTEGGWGSFLSYQGGPPGKNKRPDWWRPIAVGVAAPQKLSADVLADQRATRMYLMRAVLECRKYLGLKPLTTPALGGKETADTPDDVESGPAQSG
jgi:1-acyl-sn-glycerol-3-phosphate acyltransferase